MKVFISGVAGFLGSHLADRFLRHGEVVGIDDLSGGDARNIPVGVRWNRVTCAERSLASQLMDKCDVVYHTAALPHEGLSVFSPHTITRSIYDASVAMMSMAIDRKVKRFVFCSSMARYGRGMPPFFEDHPTAPVDPYGIAKVAAEDTLRVLANTHGVEFVVAVPHNIVGPRQKYDDPYRNVAAIMVNRVLQGKRPIVYGDGEQLRCFSDIRDVLSTLELLATADCSDEVFNVGPDEQWISINDLAKLVCEMLNVPFDPIRLPARPLEVRVAVCSSQKIRTRFGYKTRHSLENTVQSLIDWVRQNGPQPFKWHLPIEIRSEKIPLPFMTHDFEEASDVGMPDAKQAA